MKKLLVLAIFVLFGVQLNAQMPDKMPEISLTPDAADTPDYRQFYRPLENLLRANPAAKAELIRHASELHRKFNYAALPGREAQVVFLGEMHNQDAVSREINVILHQWTKNAKLGFTHFGSEFLLQSRQPQFDEYAPKTASVKELEPHISYNEHYGVYNGGIVAMWLARHAGLKVEGLDIDDIYEKSVAWAIGPEGLQKRNSAWAEKITSVLRKNPSARFIVHGGMLHSQYTHSPVDSVSTLLNARGIKTKVIQFEIGPEEQPANSRALDGGKSFYRNAWYDLLKKHDMEKRSWYIPVPAAYAQQLGADAIIYMANPNWLRQASQKEIEKVLDMKGFNDPQCELSPDSSICKRIREITLR